MRTSLVVIATLAICASALAQTVNQNEVNRWDLSTEFTSRGSVGGVAGYLSASHPFGLNAGLATLTHSQYVMQDQDLATNEPWNVGSCGLDAAGDPDYAKLTAYASNLRLPTGSGIAAYILTHTLTGAPHTPPATTDQWHHVWHLVQAANWTTDGISVHMSQAATWGTPPTLLCQLNPNSTPGHRELPRIEGTTQIIEDLAWSSQPSNQRPLVQDRTWRLRLGFNEIALVPGIDNVTYNNSPCPNPTWGLGAVDPDFYDSGVSTPARFDDYVWRVNAGATYAGGVGVLLVSQTVFPGNGIPTPYGQLYLDITDPLFGIGPLVMPPFDGTGGSQFTLALGAGPNAIRNVFKELASWSTQALVTPLTNPKWKLSSLSTMRPALAPSGFTATTAVSGTPASIVRTVGPTRFSLRNDGRGELTVQFFIGSAPVPGTFKVAERTMVRMTPPVAANKVEVTSTKTTATNFVYAHK